MLHIGKRVIKTCLAVILCLVIYMFLMVLDNVLQMDRNVDSFAPTNWYTPFFATIATVYAMQNNPQGSIAQAKLRSMGSLFGGIFGAVIIFIFEFTYLKLAHASNLSEVSNTYLFKVLEFIVTTLGIMFLIPFTVKVKWPQTTFISCLTYLSVTISIRNGGMDVFFFAFNRILSTIIGVLLSLFINTFPHFRKKNKDIMFISSLDNALLDHDSLLTPFSKYKLNEIYNDGCSLTFMTTRALTSLGNIFKDVHLVEPIIVMNGVAIYNPTTREYSNVKEINHDTRFVIEKILNDSGADYFSYLINNGVLNCYYNKLEHDGSKRYYDDRKNGVYYSFAEAITPLKLNVGQFVLIEKNELVDSIIESLKENNVEETCNIIHYPYNKIDGYSFLKINSKEASKEASLEVLQKEHQQFKLVVGSGRTDLEAMEKADFAICPNHAPDYVKEKADYVLNSDNPDELLKFIANIYHKKNYKEYLKTLSK